MELLLDPLHEEADDGRDRGSVREYVGLGGAFPLPVPLTSGVLKILGRLPNAEVYSFNLKLRKFDREILQT